MIDTVVLVGGATRPIPGKQAAAYEQPELLEWLRTGRLTLVDEDKQPVPLEQWSELPADVRARALADFNRLVSANTKAAVIFLR